MSARDDDKVLRHCLRQLLSRAGFRAHELQAFRELVRRLRPFRRGLDADELVQEVVAGFLARRSRLTGLCALPPGALVPAFRRTLREVSFETLRAGELGTLLKALDEVVRTHPRLRLERGRVVRDPAGPAPWPTRLHRPDGRYDHARLAEAVEAAVAEDGPLSKASLAKALDAAYSPPGEVLFVDGPAVRYARERCARDLVSRLAPAERLTLRAQLDDWRLREIAASLDLAVSTAWRLVEGVKEDLALALDRAGLGERDLAPVLRLVARHLDEALRRAA